MINQDKSYLEGERQCEICKGTYFKKYGMGNTKCESCRSIEKYRKYKDKYRGYAREWARKDRAERPWRSKAADQRRAATRDLLLERYGMTKEEYAAKYEAQNKGCYICGGKSVIPNSERDLYVDHDHDTGAIRDLLCNHCNTGLGQFFDNPELLEKAAAYLRKHGK